MMKSLAILLLAVAPQAFANSRPVQLSYDQVAQKVSSENYLVLENAYKVYQAKKGISVARGNLLPKLNLWKLVNLAYDPRAWVGMIEDIAPFLVPANWFKVEEMKLIHQAQREAYRALWANEVMTAKALYVHALLDQSLLEHLTENENSLRQILEIVRTKEILGEMKEGVSKEIEVSLLALQEDKRSLQVVILEDKTLLALMMGLPGNSNVRLQPVAIPHFDRLHPIQYHHYESHALHVSPEARQFDFLIEAAKYIKKEQIFSFLGASSLSYGAGGGVFDHIPVSDGLGFGTGPSIKISKAQREILKLQKQGVQETIRRHLKILVENYNLDLEHYRNLKRRVELTRSVLDGHFERLQLGASVEPNELIQATKNYIHADTAFFAVQYRFLTTSDKLERLLFRGQYEKEPNFNLPEPKSDKRDN